MYSPQDLKYFLAIVKNGNLQLASQVLNVTQPALSHSIRRLEENLDVQLFDRTNRGLRLTSVGEKLIPMAENLLSDWDSLGKDIGNQTKLIAGRIRFGLHPSVALYSLAKFLPQFQRQHPDVDFSFFHDLSRNVTQAIVDSRIDVGVVVNPVAHMELVIKELGVDEVSLWIAKKCQDEKTLIFDPNLAQSHWLLKKIEKLGWSFPRQLESPNLEVVAELVRLGVGVGLLPSRVILENENIKKYHIQAPIFKDRICLVYKPSFRKLARGKAFIDCIVAAKI